MTSTENQNPFSDPHIPSLASLREQVEQHPGLPAQQRRDMVSACNTAAKWFGMPLSAIPASAAFLRTRFERLHPSHVGVSARRIGNVKSLLLRAMRESGLSMALAGYQCPLSSDWQTLYDRLDDKYLRCNLSRFMRYCSKQGIAPAAVNDHVSQAYLDALLVESLVKNPRVLHQTSCRVWNRASASIAGWPEVTLTVPCYSDRRYAIPSWMISPCLQAEIDGYIARLAGDDLFSGPVKPLRPRSLETIRNHIRWYISPLHHSGEDVGRIDTLAELCRFDRFATAMSWHWRRAGNRQTAGMAAIAWSIRCIAVRHLGCDDEMEARYRDAIARLRPDRTGLSAKNRESLRQFDDPVVVQRFLRCPDALWDLARKQANRQGHLLAQAAVVIEILTYAPIRLDNLTKLRLDRHVSWTGKRCRIHLPPEDVKNNEELDYLLPEPVSARIRVYVDQWHHRFTSTASVYLFPGRDGAKDSSTLRRQITRNLFEQTGIRLSPHQFRHVAGKVLLDNRPGHYEVVRKLLGHKSLSTLYEYYSGAETRAATELYDDVILGLKAGGGRKGDAGPSSRRRNDLTLFSNAGRARKRGG